MDARGLGSILILIGVMAVVVGLLLASGLLNWFGRLPGDIRFSAGNTRIFIPITSMLLVSVAATLMVNLVRRLL